MSRRADEALARAEQMLKKSSVRNDEESQVRDAVNRYQRRGGEIVKIPPGGPLADQLAEAEE